MGFILIRNSSSLCRGGMISEGPDARSDRSSGFTLVEMGIVIAIIALIAGGVLFARDMVKLAQTRKVIADIDRLSTAVNTFRLKYNTLPGDMVNPVTTIGAEAGWPPCNVPTRRSFNGNGDGRLDQTGADCWSTENSRVMQHLAIARLWEGEFAVNFGWGNAEAASIRMDGFTGPPSMTWMNISYPGVIMVNLHDNTLRSINGGNLDGLLWSALNYGHSVNLGGFWYSGAWLPIFTPDQAYAFDAKIDDGMPLNGRVTSVTYGIAVSGNCLSNFNSGATWDINVANTVYNNTG